MNESMRQEIALFISVWIDRSIGEWTSRSKNVLEGSSGTDPSSSPPWRETHRRQNDPRLVHAVQKRGL